MTINRRERAALLAVRRETLVALAQVQRDVVAIHWRALGPSLRWIERGLRVWALVRDHPWAVVAPIAAVMVFRPRWVWRIGGVFVALSRARRWLR